ncbi:MAG: patatin-like phospholipase family protein [Polyangiaceae bacterium]
MTHDITLRSWLREAPFDLALSAGFFGFFAHAGVLSVLEEEDLLPARLSGASAGALVSGLFAAGLSSEALQSELFSLRREDFWDPAVGPGLLRGRLFRERVRALLPTTRFEEVRVPVALSVFDLFSRKTHVLERGDLADAICASCALPGLFRPVWIGGRPYIDGGVADRPGIRGTRGSRVLYHHLASRSPWRFTVPFPERDGLVSLVYEGLPRVGPFRLDVGLRAFEEARRRTRTRLDAPLHG